jgi:GT2 family glycosyltransferase
MSEPLISVIIVNYNGIEFVDVCLKSVLSARYLNFEVIFVDNGSTDGSREFVKNKFANDPRMRFLDNGSSLGPAVGRNKGANLARGKYLVFLDNDTRVDPEGLRELAAVFESDPSVGAAQAKLLRMDTDNLYDCAGDYLGPLGFLIERSRGAKDKGQFDYIGDILSAKSAASAIRADLFRGVGGFDEDYYMYLEETDLSWRVWLAGLRVVFVPGAIVYHAFNTPRKGFKRYYPKKIVRFYGCRNYITTLIKNLGLAGLIKILPLHILAWLVISFLFLLKGSFKDAWYILAGIWWNVLNINAVLKKRRFNNLSIRAASDRFILEKIKSKERLGEYFKKLSIYLRIGL